MTTMWELINAARAAHGLPPYAVNARLTQSAQRHAADIAGNPVHTTDPAQYHIGTDGSTIYQRIRDTGYEPAQWSEVTGWGFGGDRQAMLNWWLNSPTHRPIILSSALTECGIAMVYQPGSMWNYYWCIDFGRPKGGQPKPTYEVYVPMVANDGIDLLDYIRGDGRMYDVRHADGSTETFQTRQFIIDNRQQWRYVGNVSVKGKAIGIGVGTAGRLSGTADLLIDSIVLLATTNGNGRAVYISDNQAVEKIFLNQAAVYYRNPHVTAAATVSSSDYYDINVFRGDPLLSLPGGHNAIAVSFLSNQRHAGGTRWRSINQAGNVTNLTLSGLHVTAGNFALE